MQRNKLGISVVFFVTIVAMFSSQANAQVYFLDFNNESAFALGQGIGASQTVKADAFNVATITTVDLFAPEFADDGTGIFAPTGNTLFASAGDGVTTQTSSGSLGIDNPSVSNIAFGGAGSESRDLNDGEGWVVEFDANLLVTAVNLSSLRGGTLTVTIDGIGTFDFTDVGIAGDEFPDPFGVDFIPAGTNFTFAFSSPASHGSASFRINSFTFINQLVADGFGDINQDGCINFFDIQAFIAILSSGEYDRSADLNFDEEVSFLDIPPFIAILAGI